MNIPIHTACICLATACTVMNMKSISVHAFLVVNLKRTTFTTSLIPSTIVQNRQRHHGQLYVKQIGNGRIDSGEDEDENENNENSISPSQLEQILQNKRPSSSSNTIQNSNSRLRQATDEEIAAAEQVAGNVAVPKTGISISDEMTSIQSKENYISQLFPLIVNQKEEEKYQRQQRDGGGDDSVATCTVAAIQTISTNSIGDEQMRYIVALDQYDNNYDNTRLGIQQQRQYAMIDVPPYSDDLVAQIKSFMNNNYNHNHDDDIKAKESNGNLSCILITCRDGIHYDESPAVYITRKSDLSKWKQAFPNVQIIMYRLDTPRDCKDMITQTLDGYGPWALGIDGGDDKANNDDAVADNGRMKFIETGRPLTRMEWDEDVQVSVIDNGNLPPDDNGDNEEEQEEDAKYSPQAIKKREENKNILAVYTPGHTFGSVTYLFPKVNVCCSGYTIPVEDTRSSANIAGLSTAGPALDYRGYITTNSGGIARQIQSARGLVNTYGDRFTILLPSRGPPVKLGQYSVVERQRILLDMLNEYAELGRIYESMGII